MNPKNDIVGHPANVPFVIILQKGETYSAQAVSTAAGLHLSGSTVVADKPIAINANAGDINPDMIQYLP